MCCATHRTHYVVATMCIGLSKDIARREHLPLFRSMRLTFSEISWNEAHSFIPSVLKRSLRNFVMSFSTPSVMTKSRPTRPALGHPEGFTPFCEFLAQSAPVQNIILDPLSCKRFPCAGTNVHTRKGVSALDQKPTAFHHKSSGKMGLEAGQAGCGHKRSGTDLAVEFCSPPGHACVTSSNVASYGYTLSMQGCGEGLRGQEIRKTKSGNSLPPHASNAGYSSFGLRKLAHDVLEANPAI